MARPQAADYDSRRGLMLDRAAALYARYGFLGTSIADIAQACGVSKSLLYHYFGSKEDMLFELMSDHVEQLRQVAEAVGREGSNDPAATLSRLTHAFLRAYVGAADRHKVLVNDLDKLPPDRRAAVVAIERGLVDQVADLLGRIGPRFGADPARLRASAMLYFGMINWTHTWYRPDGPVGIDELAEQALRILLGPKPDQPNTKS